MIHRSGSGSNVHLSVHFVMSVQRRPGNERFCTKLAMIRPLARVISFVNDQRGMLGERFSTRVAAVRFLPCMSPFVNDQGAPLAKSFAADVADQQLLPAVKTEMILERSLGRHRFPAKMAGVLVLAHMGLHVEHQRILVHERLPAKFALMLHRFEVWVVKLQMLYEAVIVRERLVAILADVLLGAVLHVHVTVQLGVCEESFLADLAIPRVLFEMAPLMDGQLERLNERVAAHVAHEVLLPRVDSPVDGQSVAPFERLSTNVTLVRSSVAVRHKMAFVQILRSEKLPAYLTLIERLRRRIPLPRCSRVVLFQRPFAFLLVRGYNVAIAYFFDIDETLRILVEFPLIRRRSILFFQDRKYYHRFFRDHIFYRWFDPRNRWRSAKKMKKKSVVNSDSLFYWFRSNDNFRFFFLL